MTRRVATASDGTGGGAVGWTRPRRRAGGHPVHSRTTITTTAMQSRSKSVATGHGKAKSADGTRREWQREDLHVVLVHPQIPQNTGNVARTCAATSVALHLVGPTGFKLDDAKLKRAGLDYWDWVTVDVHEDIDVFLRFFDGIPGEKRLFAFSKFGKQHYAKEGLYVPGRKNFLMYGAETTGLPDVAHEAAVRSKGSIVKITMHNSEHVRSLNLATSVGIGLFEALRQMEGPVLEV